MPSDPLWLLPAAPAKEFQALGLDLKIINDDGETLDLKEIEEDEDKEDINPNLDEVELGPVIKDIEEPDDAWEETSEFDEEDSLDDIEDDDIDLDEGGEF